MPRTFSADDDKKEERKFFNDWIKKKERIHYNGAVRSVHEGEVWWCAIGENVGTEINGKSADFSRPVVILKKTGRYSFVGIPLSSQTWHEGTWYTHFRFQNKEQVAVISQPRSLCVQRLYRKIGQLDDTDLMKIKEGFRQLYC